MPTNEVGELISRLIEELNDLDDWEVRRDAANELAKLGPGAKNALDDLWERAINDDDPDVRGFHRKGCI